MALPQGADPVVRVPLLLCGQTTASWCTRVSASHPRFRSIADQGALQSPKLWCSIVRRGIVAWVDKWWRAHYGQSSEPQRLSRCHRNSYFANNPPPLCLCHLSLPNLLDRGDTVASAAVAWQREMLKVCRDVCNAPVSRRTIHTPVDVARDAGRQRSFWQPFGIYDSRTGQK